MIDRELSFMAVMAAVMALAAGHDTALAREKPLDHDVYDSWQSVSGVRMSDNGLTLV